MVFPLISFEVKEGPRFVPQFYLRVRTDDIISAYDFAEEIGEIPVLEDIFFEFYEAVLRCAGLRYTNLTFGWIIKDYADVVIPVFGKIFKFTARLISDCTAIWAQTPTDMAYP